MNDPTWTQKERAAWERYVRASEAFRVAGAVEQEAREAWMKLYREIEAEAKRTRKTEVKDAPF